MSTCSKCGCKRNRSGYCPTCYQIKKYGSSHSTSPGSYTGTDVHLSDGRRYKVYERSNGTKYYLVGGKERTLRSNQKVVRSREDTHQEYYDQWEDMDKKSSTCHVTQEASPQTEAIETGTLSISQPFDRAFEMIYSSELEATAYKTTSPGPNGSQSLAQGASKIPTAPPRTTASPSPPRTTASLSPSIPRRLYVVPSTDSRQMQTQTSTQATSTACAPKPNQKPRQDATKPSTASMAYSTIPSTSTVRQTQTLTTSTTRPSTTCTNTKQTAKHCQMLSSVTRPATVTDKKQAATSLLPSTTTTCTNAAIVKQQNTNTAKKQSSQIIVGVPTIPYTFPPCLQATKDKVSLEHVEIWSAEWAIVNDRIRETLPYVTIQSIQRIQNKWLWKRYMFAKTWMMEKNGGVINEKLLFHGTSETPPEKVFRSEFGFDFRYCLKGKWGIGTYFAVNASYSNSYSYKPQNKGYRQMLMANVLTGESCRCAPDDTLRRPPTRKIGTDTGDGEDETCYDTVCGFIGGNDVFVVYDHEKANPKYLITYNVNTI